MDKADGRADPGAAQVRSLPLGSWIFSTDDHLLESTDTFAGRVPGRYTDAAPHIVVDDDGGDAWVLGDELVPISFADGTASWTVDERPLLGVRWQAQQGLPDGATPQGPARTALERRDRGLVRVEEDFHPSVYDVDARIEAMDRDGVWTSVLIPSISFGFAGQRFSMLNDGDAGLAFVRAYNDWLAEEVQGRHPGRLIASQIPWFRDPEIAAAEVRKNAARGFKATLFAENPERFGFPSIHTGHWDPFFAACEETDTVLNVHLGTGLQPTPVSSDSPLPVLKASVAVNSSLSAFDWVFSGIAIRFPNIKVSFTEGGIDFVPLVYGRLETLTRDMLEGFWDEAISPAELLARNFWFAALFDVGAYSFLADRMPDHGMVETDFPHGDTMWPNSQEHFAGRLHGLTPEHRERFLLTNASSLYRHPIDGRPPATLATPVGATAGSVQ